MHSDQYHLNYFIWYTILSWKKLSSPQTIRRKCSECKITSKGQNRSFSYKLQHCKMKQKSDFLFILPQIISFIPRHQWKRKPSLAPCVIVVHNLGRMFNCYWLWRLLAQLSVWVKITLDRCAGSDWVIWSLGVMHLMVSFVLWNEICTVTFTETFCIHNSEIWRLIKQTFCILRTEKDRWGN